MTGSDTEPPASLATHLEAPPAWRGVTCADWLSVVEPHLAEPLVSAAAGRRLRAVARSLPGGGLCALEARLAAGAERVDLSYRLTDPARAPSLVPRLADPRLERFLTRWSRRESELHPVRSVWLELDLDREPGGQLDPVFCAELRGRVETRWLLDVLVPALDGRPSSARRRRRIARCLEAVPPGGELLYVFALGARGTGATRLELHRMQPAAMVAYLETVAPAETARRAADLAPLVAGCDRYHLSFDVDCEIEPRIGLEASCRRLPHREPGWARLADRLVDRGLCTPDKRDAVLAWPGWDNAATAAGRWPGALARPGIFCARALSHFKLVSLPGREPAAKAYLLFEPLDKSPAAPGVGVTPGP